MRVVQLSPEQLDDARALQLKREESLRQVDESRRELDKLYRTAAQLKPEERFQLSDDGQTLIISTKEYGGQWF